jgi:hypothetical protein
VAQQQLLLQQSIMVSLENEKGVDKFFLAPKPTNSNFDLREILWHCSIGGNRDMER